MLHRNIYAGTPEHASMGTGSQGGSAEGVTRLLR
jgi:hypothetical protein